MSETSDRLREAIAASGLSYGALAERTGVPKSAIQRYATGKTAKIPSDRLDALAKALGVTGASLMGAAQARERSAEEAELEAMLAELRSREDMRMLFKLAKGASPEDVRRAVSIIEALRR